MHFTKFFFFVFSSVFLSVFLSPEWMHGEVIEDCIPYPQEHVEEYMGHRPAWDYPVQIYLDHVEGHWLDNHDGYTTFGAFFASPNIVTNSTLIFCDARLHMFNEGKSAGNFGGGLRHIFHEHSKVFGINAYYDYRIGNWNKYFHQVGLGLELLSPTWDLRVNGYLPTSGWGHSKTVRFDNFVGDFFATRRKRRKGLAGGDVEIGYWIKRRELCDWYDLYGAVGTYYYSSQKDQRAAFGGEVRLAANVGRFFNFEVRGGYDKVYHGHVQGRITLTIPFDMKYITGGMTWFEDDRPQCPIIDIYVKRNSFEPAYIPCETQNCNDGYCINEIAYQPVRRQEIMVLSKKECCWTWNWDAPCSDCYSSD